MADTAHATGSHDMELVEKEIAEIAKQPCQVVFNGRPSGDSDRSTSPGSNQSIETIPENEQASDITLFDLDTGKIHCIKEGEEFVDQPQLVKPSSPRPSRISKRKSSPKSQRAWDGWWKEKRTRDELLWIAAAKGELSTLQDALAQPEDGSAPAQISSRSLGGRTALHIAAGVGNLDCVRCLLDCSSDMSAVTENGLTALHVACREGHAEVACLLVERGSDIYTETNDQSLAAHIAAAPGHSEILTILLEHGGSEQLRRRNSIGQRPADLARSLEVQTRLAAALGTEEEASIAARDSYMGRTAAGHLDVLLHNSRADVVSRMLHLMHRGTGRDILAPCPDAPGSGARLPKMEPKDAPSRCQELKSFTKVHHHNAIEEVRLDSFQPMTKLGAGTFGVVYKVEHKKTKSIYAMKLLDKSKIMASGSLMRYTMCERNLLSYIKHPYIVQLHYAFQTPTHLVLVLQYCPRGNMQSLLRKHGRLPVAMSRIYGAQVLLAICHLHERDTVYRDMKPENVVLDQDGNAMLTDFGLSKEGVHGLDSAKSFCGSWAFMAPEIIRRKGHGKTVDIYGLGVMTYCMLVGTPPFYDRSKDTLLHNIKHMPLNIPQAVPADAVVFIKATMVREAKQRLGAERTEDIKSHVWFADMDWDALMNREVQVPLEGIFQEENRRVNASDPSISAEAAFGQLHKNARARSSQNVPNWEFASPGEKDMGRR